MTCNFNSPYNPPQILRRHPQRKLCQLSYQDITMLSLQNQINPSILSLVLALFVHSTTSIRRTVFVKLSKYYWSADLLPLSFQISLVLFGHRKSKNAFITNANRSMLNYQCPSQQLWCFPNPFFRSQTQTSLIRRTLHMKKPINLNICIPIT